MPLNLTSYQQTCLAEMCAMAAQMRRLIDDADRESKAPNYALMGEKFCDFLVRFESTSSQDFGMLYDKLHRTGANA